MDNFLQNKKFLVLGVILILIIVGGLFYYFDYFGLKSRLWPSQYKLNIPPLNPSQNPFLNPNTSSVKLDCAKETNDVAKDACWQSKAVSDKNMTFCNSIKTDNPFVSKDGCFNLVAQSKKDIKICSLIKNANIRKNCENTIKNPLRLAPSGSRNAGQ